MDTYIAFYMAIGFFSGVINGVHSIVYEKNYDYFSAPVILLLLWPIVMVLYLQYIMAELIAFYILERRNNG